MAVEARVEERLREILQQREGATPPVTGFLSVEWRSFLNRWDQAGIFPIQVAQRFMSEMPRWASRVGEDSSSTEVSQQLEDYARELEHRVEQWCGPEGSVRRRELRGYQARRPNMFT